MTTIIEQADRIVGIDTKINLWCAADQNIYRRGAFCEWLSKHPVDPESAVHLPRPFDGIHTPLETLASEIVTTHERETQPKQPDDGLPPGPWIIEHHTINSGDHSEHCIEVRLSHDRTMGKNDAEALTDFYVRCSSPTMRRMLAAFEVTEERPSGDKGKDACRLCLFADRSFRAMDQACPIPLSANVICWLTPRSKP